MIIKVMDLISGHMNGVKNYIFPFFTFSDKHGTCAQTLPIMDTEHAYFSSAIKLHNQFDPLVILSLQTPNFLIFFQQALNSAGILPSNSTTYGYNNIVNAIQK